MPPTPVDPERVTAEDLATLAGSTGERITMLAARGILAPSADGRFAIADVHRVRLLEAFEAAGQLSLRLGELARAQAEAHGGRLVKLLGDGVLLRLPDGATAVRASLDLLEALPRAGLPTGHAGVHAGPVIEREGDVYGRTVNLAARISDRAPDGSLYVTADVASDLDGSTFVVTSLGPHDLQGIGSVELYRVDAGR